MRATALSRSFGSLRGTSRNGSFEGSFASAATSASVTSGIGRDGRDAHGLSLVLLSSVVVHDAPDAIVPRPAPVRVPPAFRDASKRVGSYPAEQPQGQHRVTPQRQTQKRRGSPRLRVFPFLEVLTQARQVFAPSDPVPSVGVDPALVLRVDEQRRLEVCVWLNRVGRFGQ